MNRNFESHHRNSRNYSNNRRDDQDFSERDLGSEFEISHNNGSHGRQNKDSSGKQPGIVASSRAADDALNYRSLGWGNDDESTRTQQRTVDRARKRSLSPRGRSPNRYTRNHSRSRSLSSSNSGNSSRDRTRRRRLRSRSRSPQLPQKQSAVLRSLVLLNVSPRVKTGHLVEIKGTIFDNKDSRGDVILLTREKYSSTYLLEFQSRGEAETALRKFDGATIDGKRVRCRFMNKEDESFM